jgi:hypothetical protein
MMRNTKKKALYEVISTAKSKTDFEQLHPQVSAGNTSADSEPGVLPSVIRWIRKPRFVQFNAGRIEFSMPYQVAVATLLGLILVILLAFRLGQRLASNDASAVSPAKQAAAGKTAEQSSRTADSSAARSDRAKQQSGRNRIVIQMFQVSSHLEPVKEYFDKLGVETEIIERNNWYYLVTKNKYDNIDKPGTDGYAAKQKITELGAGYKAPQGFETFGAKPFSGAFGMKFEE